MLYADKKLHQDNKGYHVGDLIPEPQYVDRILADGDELNFIIRHMKDIPITSNRVVTWHGEFARFIACNWNLLNYK